MAAGVLDRVPVDEITERAAAMRPGRFALTLAAIPFFLVGYAVAVVFGVLWKCGKWVAAAFLVGWTRAAGPSKTTRIAALTAQVEDLQMQVSRFS